ncbi:MAG TPA: O-fucosyltransferase family protein [Kouleothrix sp.]|nr:O-fucosyltransferase family protein [Kouleothrix sp.]HRC75216.1 O-fucosyltransferase family protein [Kouleothrix sp.]
MAKQQPAGTAAAPGTRRLFIPGYYSGYSNNKMSLDIAIALAYLTGRVLVPYRFRLPRRFKIDTPQDQVLEPMLVPELFDIPIPWSNEYLFKTWISVPGAAVCAWAPIHESVLCFPNRPPDDDEHFRHFRNGRKHVYTLSERENEAPDLHINADTLGLYSYFAYLDDKQRRAVVDLMRRVRPKQQYRDIADRIAASLGEFNAVHIRRDDFVSNALSKEKITRAASISGQEIVANLATRMNRDDPLVVCTDGSSREEIFGPIQQHFRTTIFLDRYLRESPSMRDLMAGLPQGNEAIDALVTQLVASKAQVFAGTLFSTFTALIHRFRAFERQESSFLYCYNDFLLPLVRYDRCEFLPVDDGPYTWNRLRYPVSPDAYSWLREWPEAAGGAPPPFDGAPLPAGTITLHASQAHTHGSAVECASDHGDQVVIANWTEQSAFVSWELVLPAGATFAVEVRYACPMETAGSRYAVGVEGGDELYGQVWNTGSWFSLSSWFPLGRLRAPAGHCRLIVRAIDMAGYALMNLSAIRLVPV